MSRWSILSLLLVTMTTLGCSGLVGQRYASDALAPTGGPLRDHLAGHAHFATESVGYPMHHADPMGDYGAAGCATCGTEQLTVMAPHVRHSCDGGKQCTPYCDRCAGGTHLPVGALEGMPLLERIKSRFVCGDGCGEVYIGEWISTPPTPDPCDVCGNFTGYCNHQMYRPSQQPVRRALSLLAGVRDADTGCGGCGQVGCDDCDQALSTGYDYQQAPFVHPPACNCGGH